MPRIRTNTPHSQASILVRAMAHGRRAEADRFRANRISDAAREISMTPGQRDRALRQAAGFARSAARHALAADRLGEENIRMGG